MKNLAVRSLTVFAVVLVIQLMSLPCTAQMGGGRGQGRTMGRHFYNTETEVTIQGIVDNVLQVTGKDATVRMEKCPRGWTGTHLRLKTDAGTLHVHVGPSAYLARKNFSIAIGDKLTVLGSKVQYQGSDFLIAKEITKGNEVLTLRNSTGFPLWTGFRLESTPLPATP